MTASLSSTSCPSPVEPPRLSSYFMIGKDSSGKNAVYQIRILETDEKGVDRPIALTKAQWEEEKTILQETLKPFFMGSEPKPASFEVSINPNEIKLTSKCRTIFSQVITPQTSKDFHQIITERGGRKFAWELVPIPTFDNTWETIFSFDPKLKPPRIANEDNDCFILAYLYGFVFNNKNFVSRLQELAREESDEKKAAALKCILCFLYRCHEAQQSNSTNPVFGVNELRKALAILNENPEIYNDKQNVLIESSMFIQSQFHEDLPINYQDECPTGFIPTPYQNNKPLQEMIRESISDEYRWANPPSHLNFYLQEKKFIQLSVKPEDTLTLTLEKTYWADEPDSDQSYELTTVVRHLGEPGQGGHYVTYAKYGDNYFKFKNDAIGTIDTSNQTEFLDATKNPYALGYTPKSVLPPQAPAPASPPPPVVTRPAVPANFAKRKLRHPPASLAPSTPP